LVEGVKEYSQGAYWRRNIRGGPPPQKRLKGPKTPSGKILGVKPPWGIPPYGEGRNWDLRSFKNLHHRGFFWDLGPYTLRGEKPSSGENRGGVLRGFLENHPPDWGGGNRGGNSYIRV